MSKDKSKSRLLGLLKFKEKFSKNKDNQEVFKCKECNMKFNAKERMEAHKKIAHSGKGEKKKQTHR
jgi:hypothetical protein